MQKSIFTLIIPIHNGDSTIKNTLDSIIKQKNLSLIKTIILINDGSTDQSQTEIENFKKQNKLNIKIIRHKKSSGLSSSLNEGIKNANTEYVITAHQDIVLKENTALTKLKNIINKNPNVFYIYPTIYHPKYIWDKYNFWQKYLFSRYVDTKYDSPIEKFDCINRLKLTNIGLFDEKHFRTAGEDIDLILRAKKAKLIYICSKIKTIHIHNKNPNFSFKDLVKKERQLAETKGVLLRLYGFVIPNLRSFFRECLFVSLFIPKIRIFGALLLIFYIFGYNWKMYQLVGKDSKAFLVPFINLYLLIANITSSTKAFFNKKQII